MSQEQDAQQNHNIVPNGYDTGRDALVKLATTGTTSNGGVKYSTTSETVTGLLPAGSAGVNHGESNIGNIIYELLIISPLGISQDGNVILLTVTIL